METIQHQFLCNDKSPQRLDKFLVSQLNEFSRSRLQGLIKEGFVRVNGEVMFKTGYDLDSGDKVIISIPAPKPLKLKAENIPLDIIFENEDVIVVNKPAGMVVHPSAGHHQGTLVNALLAHNPFLSGIGGKQRPGIVHRLDKNTSGVILVAKNDRTHIFLQNQFHQRKVKKTYLALVDGSPPTKTGRIEAPIYRDRIHRKRMAIAPLGKGKVAVTEYRTLRSYKKHTYLEVHPLTGRTHQIRVHMAFLKCPISGDTIYGRKKSSINIERHFLHAHILEVRFEGDNKSHQFIAPLSTDLLDLLNELNSEFKGE